MTGQRSHAVIDTDAVSTCGVFRDEAWRKRCVQVAVHTGWNVEKPYTKQARLYKQHVIQREEVPG